MKLQKFAFIISALLFTTLISCDDERNNSPEGDRVKATFTAGISTRVSDVMWDVNDAIGLAMVDAAAQGTILENVYNRRYYTTTTSGNFIPATPDDIIYFPQNGQEVRFKSYYPYLETVGQDLIIPLSVADQTDMSAIDFMSAVHESGFSKEDPNVNLRFHHRLSQVIFRVSVAGDVSNIQLQNVTLTAKGMATSGVYNLNNETLTVNQGSVADVVIPRRGAANERIGIVMPRPAGEGVSFELTTPEGSNFIADMPADLTLEAGHKYIFNVLLEGTAISLSVTIEDWVEGPVTNLDVVGIATPAGESVGVAPGDRLQVYMRNGNDFEPLTLFTYNTEGEWTTTDPVFWEDITADPVDLRASLLPREPAKNDTQLPDIILSNELSVPHNTGADFVLNHVGSRVAVVLQSNVFTADELSAATITLPEYLTGGQEVNGVFVPGTTRQDVLIDRTDPQDQFAIIQPQPVSAGGGLVNILINGRTYTATAGDQGFLFEAGVAYQLVITVNSNEVRVSARVVDWIPSAPHEFEILQVTPTLEDTEGVDVGARMAVYRNDGTDYTSWANFTYTGGNTWVPDTEVFWESIVGNSVDLRASIVAQPRLNEYQMDDLLIADDITVPYATGVDFVFRHVASRLLVRLISDTFTQADLDGATVILPQYTDGGTELNGQFVPGQAVNDIPMVIVPGATRAVASTNPHVALIQPQTIDAGRYMFRVRIGTRDYFATAPQGGFAYEAGTAYGITIHVNEDNVTVSAQVIPWNQTSFDLNAFRIGTSLPGASSGINNGEQMSVYISNGAARDLLSTFTYNAAGDSWTSSPAVFWENISGTPAFYASILRAPRLNDTQLDDYLVADPVTPVEGTPVNFTLRHPASQVIVQLRSNDGTFTSAELSNMIITLPNYIIGGDINNGLFEFPQDNPTGTVTVEKVNNSAVALIRPQTAVAGRTVVNIQDPATGRNYPVEHSVNIQFAAGLATTLVVNMEKSAIRLSAEVIDWQEGPTLPLVPQAIEISGTLEQTSAFFRDKTIYAYVMGDNPQELTYSYLPVAPGSTTYTWQGTQTLYWDDFQNLPLNITGVYYPAQASVPTLAEGQTNFAWNLPTDQSQGYDAYDLLMSRLSMAVPTYANFNFNHVLSRIRVRVISDEFTPDEFQDMSVSLNNLRLNGTASLVSGQVTAANSRSTVTPLMQTVQNETSYSALVMPQVVNTGTTIATITLRDYPNTPFAAVLTSNLSFEPGRETVITITLRKTEVVISATLEDWTAGDSGNIIIQ